MDKHYFGGEVLRKILVVALILILWDLLVGKKADRGFGFMGGDLI